MSASQFKALQSKLEAVERVVLSLTGCSLPSTPVASNNDAQVKALSTQVASLQQQLNQLQEQLKKHCNEVRDNVAKSIQAVKCNHQCKCDEVKAQLEEQMKTVCKCNNINDDVDDNDEVQDENVPITKKRGAKKNSK